MEQIKLQTFIPKPHTRDNKYTEVMTAINANSVARDQPTGCEASPGATLLEYSRILLIYLSSFNSEGQDLHTVSHNFN